MHSRTTLPWALTVLIALAGCELRRPTDAGGDPLAQVVVKPESVVLDPQQTQAFQAFGVTAAGDTVPATVAWSASAGTITASGVYTADASPADVTVTATLGGGHLTGSGHVRKRRLVQIVLTPASASVQAGSTQQFATYGRRNTGDSVAVNVSYSATGGTITPSGLYTAGSTAGAFRVIAGEAATSLSDTSAISVTDAPPPPPGGGTILVREDFETAGFGQRGWYDFRSDPTLTDTTHSVGSTRALEARYAAGTRTPSWVAARHLFAPSPTVYVSYWVRYSANWVGSGRAYHPHEFQIMSDLDGDFDGLSNGWMVAYIEQGYQNGGIPRLSVQDSKAINTSYGAPPIDLSRITENRSIGGCNGVVESNVIVDCFSFPPWYNHKEVNASQVSFQPTPGPGYKGNWNHVEAYFQINSIVNGIGQADGVMQYWFNGTLVIDRHDILFRTGARPNIKFRQFVIAPYIGDNSPVNQTMWVDNLIVATARP